MKTKKIFLRITSGLDYSRHEATGGIFTYTCVNLFCPHDHDHDSNIFHPYHQVNRQQSTSSLRMLTRGASQSWFVTQTMTNRGERGTETDFHLNTLKLIKQTVTNSLLSDQSLLDPDHHLQADWKMILRESTVRRRGSRLLLPTLDSTETVKNKRSKFRVE